MLDLCELHFTRLSVRVFLCVFVPAPLPSCSGHPGDARDAFMAPSLPPSSSNMPRQAHAPRIDGAHDAQGRVPSHAAAQQVAGSGAEGRAHGGFVELRPDAKRGRTRKGSGDETYNIRCIETIYI